MASVQINAPLCIAAGAIFPPVCTCLVIARFKARRLQNAHIGLDDWLTVPALLLLLGIAIATLDGVARHSVGYKTPPLKPGETILSTNSYEQKTVRSILWAIEVMQIPALGFIKSSLVLFYRRALVTKQSRVFDIASYIVLALIALWTIAFFLAFVLVCGTRPTAFWSTLLDLKAYCVDTVMLHDGLGISDFILDLIVIILPVPIIWRLQMSVKRKIAVVAIFGFGTMWDSLTVESFLKMLTSVRSIVASGLRMVTYLQSTKAEFKSETDTDILLTGGIYWGFVETGLALICCCLLSLQGPYRKWAVATLKRAYSTSREKLHLSDIEEANQHRVPSTPRAGTPFSGRVKSNTTISFTGGGSAHPHGRKDEIYWTRTVDTTEQSRSDSYSNLAPKNTL